MTAHAYFPKRVKVLEVYDNWEWGGLNDESSAISGLLENTTLLNTQRRILLKGEIVS